MSYKTVGLEDSEDRVFVSLNPLGPAVSAHRSRPRLALLAFKRASPAHAGGANPEPLADLAVTQTLRYRSRTRMRRSIESGVGMSAGLLPGRQLESSERRFGHPPRFNPLGHRSSPTVAAELTLMRTAVTRRSS